MSFTQRLNLGKDRMSAAKRLPAVPLINRRLLANKMIVEEHPDEYSMQSSILYADLGRLKSAFPIAPGIHAAPEPCIITTNADRLQLASMGLDAIEKFTSLPLSSRLPNVS